MKSRISGRPGRNRCPAFRDRILTGKLNKKYIFGQPNHRGGRIKPRNPNGPKAVSAFLFAAPLLQNLLKSNEAKAYPTGGEPIVPAETKITAEVGAKPKETNDSSNFWLIAGPILGVLALGAALMKWRSKRQGDKFYKNALGAKVIPLNPKKKNPDEPPATEQKES